MSGVVHCTDNGPVEGFRGILKRERYYGRPFINKQKQVSAISGYISCHKTRRFQQNIVALTPMENIGSI